MATVGKNLMLRDFLNLGGLPMRTILLAIGLIAFALPALACSMSQTSSQQQTPLPVASSDQTPDQPAPPPQTKPQS